MSTRIKNGFSTGLGYVSSVPQSDNAGTAERATKDSNGQNIYNTYGNFASDLKVYNGETLTKGVYMISSTVDGARSNCIIENLGVTGVPYIAFLGTRLSASGAVVYHRACITNGILETQQSEDGRNYTKDSNGAPSYRKITQ